MPTSRITTFVVRNPRTMAVYLTVSLFKVPDDHRVIGWF